MKSNKETEKYKDKFTVGITGQGESNKPFLLPLLPFPSLYTRLTSRIRRYKTLALVSEKSVFVWHSTGKDWAQFFSFNLIWSVCYDRGSGNRLFEIKLKLFKTAKRRRSYVFAVNVFACKNILNPSINGSKSVYLWIFSIQNRNYVLASWMKT